MPCGWEGNRRSGRASQTSVVYRTLSTYGLTAQEKEMSTPPTHEVWHTTFLNPKLQR